MQIYLDSANIQHIHEAAAWGILSGVTTNPSLLAKEDPKVDIKERILEIHKLVGGHLSVEVISTDTEGMIRETEEIRGWFPEATIKIPMMPSGLAAVKELSKRNIPTNVTLIFNPIQAIAANNAGATYVSVFLGRLDDIGMNSEHILDEIKVSGTHMVLNPKSLQHQFEIHYILFIQLSLEHILQPSRTMFCVNHCNIH